MATTPHEVVEVLRKQAWSRAIGELQAVEISFYSHGKVERAEKYRRFVAARDNFLEEVETDGLLD